MQNRRLEVACNDHLPVFYSPAASTPAGVFYALAAKPLLQVALLVTTNTPLARIEAQTPNLQGNSAEKGNHWIEIEGDMTKKGGHRTEIEGGLAEKGGHRTDIEGDMTEKGGYRTDIEGDMTKKGGHRTSIVAYLEHQCDLQFITYSLI